MATGIDVSNLHTLTLGLKEWSSGLAFRILFKRAFVTALALMACSSCGPLVADITYSADPITAWIVDKDTGAPIEGVNVVAAWELKGGLEGGNIVGYVMVMEAVTDASGKFAFPAWTKRHRGWGAITNGAPKLIYFKTGYYSGAEVNSTGTDVAPAHMHSDRDGKKILLPRFTGSLEEYGRSLSLFLAIMIDELLSRDDCNWRAIPKFLWAVEQQHRVFVAQHVSEFWRLNSLDSLSQSYSRNCGSLRQYVEEHGR
jgi:hypothetical protein